MTAENSTVVFKYFDLVNRFVRIRVLSADEMTCGDAHEKDLNRDAYRKYVVKACIVDRQGVEKQGLHNAGSMDALTNLLYQLCIEVNPCLDIHKVALP